MTEHNWADSSRHNKKQPNTVSMVELAEMDGDNMSHIPPPDLSFIAREKEAEEPAFWSESEGRKQGTVSGFEFERQILESGKNPIDSLPPTDLTEGKTRLVIPTSKPRNPRVPTLENSATLRIGEKLATSETGFRAPVRSEDWY